jgi:hypothetical protein
MSMTRSGPEDFSSEAEWVDMMNCSFWLSRGPSLWCPGSDENGLVFLRLELGASHVQVSRGPIWR